MSRIFISYRRDDSAVNAGRIYDQLVQRFGDAEVFIDINAIPVGKDFKLVIENALAKCDALVAIIGKRWLKITDKHRTRRLDDPNDLVRNEIATALARNVLVIPCLIDGAKMPSEAELPSDLIKLSKLNAVTISNESFRDDILKLSSAIMEVVPPLSKPKQPAILTERPPSWSFDQFCVGASELFLTSVMLTRTITNFEGSLIQLLQNRATIRAVLPDPDISMTSYNEDGPLTTRELIDVLRDILASFTHISRLIDIGDFQLRFVRFRPVATIFLADPNEPSGRIHYLPLVYGSYMINPMRPAADITKQEHSALFENLKERYYNGLWNVGKPVNKLELEEAITVINSRINQMLNSSQNQL